MPKITTETCLGTADECYDYALKHGRLPEKFEKIIAKKAYYAFWYAKNIIKGRFELAEKIIGKTKSYAYDYAITIHKGRFELGEHKISRDANHACYYAIYNLKPLGLRFELGEPAIAKDGYASLDYSRYVLKPLGVNRFELGEPVMASNASHAYEYSTQVLEDRFELGECAIFGSPFEEEYIKFLKSKGYSVEKKIIIQIENNL